MTLRSALFVCTIAVAFAASGPMEITVHEDKPFPESLSSSSDGTLYIGSVTHSEIFKAAKGETTAEPWIKQGTYGLQRVLGVLADQKSNTLWVCSDKQNGLQGPPAALKAFDLKTGAGKASYDFPGDTGLCNDIAVGPDGTTYASDTTANRILRLKKGASTLDVWMKDDKLAGIDGIAFGDPTTIVFNTVTTGHLFKVAVKKDGVAGDLVEIKPSQALIQPDGMRAFGKNTFLMIEGAGRLDKVTVTGTNAKIVVLKDGFNGPTAVTQTGKTAWVLEGKLRYMNDPKLGDPGPFKVVPVALK